MKDDNEQVKSFKDMGICEPLVEACENFGWKTPSYFQANFIPHALKGKNLFGRAEASSHNVGAFALPILQAFFETPQKFSACVISPTRERAREIVELFKALGSCIDIKCEMGKWTDIQHARELPDIVGKWADMQHGIDFQEFPDIVVWAVEDFFHHLIFTRGSCLPTVKYLDFVLQAGLARRSGLVITLVNQNSEDEIKRLDIVEKLTGRRIEEFQSNEVEAMKFFDKVREVHNLYCEANKKYKEEEKRKKRERDGDLLDEDEHHGLLMTFIPQLVE